MKVSNESKIKINQLLSELIAHFSDLEDEVVTDLYFQPSFQDGKLILSDDEDEVLGEVVISEFEGLRGGDSLNSVACILRKALEHKRKELETLSVLKPFSFVLVDEDKETVEELLLVDDDLLLADDGLLKGLDAELDDFIKNLLSED